MDNEAQERVTNLSEEIQSLMQEKNLALLNIEKKVNKQIMGIIKTKKNKSKAFWSAAKPKDENVRINSVRKKDSSLTSSQDECLERVREHYQELFTPSDRPPNEEPLKTPHLGRTKYLTAPFKASEVKEVLKNLPKGKACGPDNIPYEALKLGYKELHRHLTEAFNLIMLTGESIEDWMGGIMHLLYKQKGDKSDLKGGVW